jgi:hypothetical protein
MSKPPPFTNVPQHKLRLGPSSPGQLVPAPPLSGTYVLESISGTTSWQAGGGGGASDYPQLPGTAENDYGYPGTLGGVPGITNISSSGGLIEITLAHAPPFDYLLTGMLVAVSAASSGTAGIAATGIWTITVIDSTHFTLNGSTFSGSYTSGGTINALGTIAEIIPTETKLAFGTPAQVDSFVLARSSNDPSTPVVVALWFISPGTIYDGSVSILGWDTGVNGISQLAYRGDLLFTAFWDGFTVVMMTPTSPTNPLNVRSNGSPTWTIAVVNSSPYVSITVTGQGAAPPAPVNWSIIGQIQMRS